MYAQDPGALLYCSDFVSGCRHIHGVQAISLVPCESAGILMQINQDPLRTDAALHL